MQQGKRTKKKAVRRKGGKKNTGLSLEKAVARIQQMMDPKTKVEHDVKLQDRVRNTRQYDVVIRGVFGGREVLGVIECKDHKRKKGPDAVEAFAKKTENLTANFRVMVSRRGFTDQALRLAKHEGIGCLSLLPHDPKQVGFGIGDMWYGRLYKWGKAFLTVFLADEKTKMPEHGYESGSVKWSGKPVIEWFEKEIFTKYDTQQQTGEYTFAAEFERVTSIEIAGEECEAKGLACTVTRLCQTKKKWVTWSGDAFYDWHSARFTIAPRGIIVGSVIDTTLADWDDFDGVIPKSEKGEPPGFCRMTFDCFELRQVPDKVVDLQSIIARASVVIGSPSQWSKPT